MYVAINADEMGFLYAHRNVDVLLNLAHIEVDAAVRVVNLENPRFYRPFQGFTDLELKLLYQNTTGEKYDGYGAQLQDIVTALALRIEELQINIVELSAQVACVTEEFAGLYKFVPGSREPQLVEDGLFGVPAKRVARCKDEERRAVAGSLLPVLLPPTRTFAPVGRDQQRAPTNAPARTPRPAGVAPPPRGSTRETIWACADRMWEEAGKPMQAGVVLALRKKIMDQLEQDGVKRTSSSNELGAWQKTRLV